MLGAGIILFFIAIFAASELVIVSTNRVNLIGNKNKLVQDFLNNPEVFISTILVGTNISIVAFTLIASEIHWANDIGKIGETIIISFFILLFGETLPKIVGMDLADRIILYVLYFLKVTYYALYPLIKLSLFLSRYILHLLGVNMEEKEYIHVGRTEISVAIKSLLEYRKKDNISSNDEEIMLSNLLNLSSKKVKEIMIPMDSIIAIPFNASKEDALNVIEEYGYSRVLLYKDKKENIFAYFHIVDMLKENKKPAKIARQIKWIYEDMPCGILLDKFKKEGEPLFIVKNRSGNIIGMVTTEDIVEELVGEIEDEYDMEEEWIEELEQNKWKVKLDAPLWIVSRKTGLPFNRDAYEGATMEEFIEEYEDDIDPSGILYIKDFKIVISNTSEKEVLIETED